MSTKAQIQYLDYLVDPSFQGVNRLFVLSFEGNAVRTGHKIFSSQSRIKRIQAYGWWKNIFWSASKKWSKNIW